MTITHPHHPLYQQRAEVLRIHRGPDPDLIIRLPDGSHAAVAMSLTDYASPPMATTHPTVLPLLELNGLRQLAQWVKQQRQERRYAAGSPREEPSV